MNGNEGDPQSDNPYAAPRPAPPVRPVEMGEPTAEMQAVDVLAKKQPWRLRVYSDLLRFDTSDDQPVVNVLRSEAAEKTIVHDALMLKRCLEVKTPKKRVFQFSADDFATLTDWLGPPTRQDLAASLKRRFGWILPIGILFVLTSLPMSGDPDAGIESLPFDPVTCGLGVSLLAIGLISRLVPHRIFFLLDSLWFLFLAADTMYDILVGKSWLWLIVVALQLSLVVSGIKQYRRFAAPPSSAPEQL